jgi:acetyl/propionyl-CoA carboxylase alpha subunit
MVARNPIADRGEIARRIARTALELGPTPAQSGVGQ